MLRSAREFQVFSICTIILRGGHQAGTSLFIFSKKSSVAGVTVYVLFSRYHRPYHPSLYRFPTSIRSLFVYFKIFALSLLYSLWFFAENRKRTKCMFPTNSVTKISTRAALKSFVACLPTSIHSYQYANINKYCEDFKTLDMIYT